MRNILGRPKEELKRGYKSAGKYVHEYGKQKTKENRKMGHITWNE
jgi:phosphoribosylaminoimidazole carboxylase (NCAIR synthetase)